MAQPAATAISTAAPGADRSARPRMDRAEQRVRVSAWGALLLVAALIAWLDSGLMNPDGVSYLDLAAAVAAGGPRAVVNAYWGPAYPLILALALKATGVPRVSDFALAHGANLVLFLVALCCFEVFLAELIRHVRRRGDLPAGAAAWLRGAAYACFGYDAIVLVNVALVTPDLLVAAIVYLLAAILLRLHRSDAGLPTYLVLGALIAAGYLAKAAMAPLGLAALAFAGAIAWRRRPGAGTAARLALAALTAASLSLPYVAAVSRQRGRFTLGETARLNYAWWVQGVPLYRYWDGSPAGTGQPLHAPLALPGVPTVHAFAGPVPGTYPLWYDPAYWHDGLKVPFEWLRQLEATLANAAQLFLKRALALVLLTFAALLAWLRVRRAGRPVHWSTWALPATAILLYLPIHIEIRFFGGFAAVALAGLLGGGARAGRARAIFAGVAIVFAGGCGFILARVARSPRVAPAAADRAALQELHRAGAGPGSSIALVGEPFDAHWAHLGAYHIVAEVPARDFWRASPERRREIVSQMRSAGASFVAVEPAPQLTAQQLNEARALGTVVLQ